MRDIYLDNSATTRVLPEVRDAMVAAMDVEYGNPSSMHHKGVEAENLVREAREKIARTLKVSEREIVFTSGGTESNNLALIGTALANQRKGRHLITTAVEHASVSSAMDWLAKQGFEVTRLAVDRAGRVDPDALTAAIRSDTILVSVMMVNNEIGTVEPVEELGRRIKAVRPDILFHVDAIQAYGKIPIRPKAMHIDLLSVSGHKIHGPKGSGFLYIRDKVKIQPILFGGGQQRDLRSGTENVPGIAGLGCAAERICSTMEEHSAQMCRCRNLLIRGLRELPEVTVNGAAGYCSEEELRLGESADSERMPAAAPQIVSASFPGVRSEVLLHSLESEGIYVSAGSACSSNGAKHASATLTALHLRGDQAESTLRFSFSIFTTEEEIRETLEVLRVILPRLRRYTRR